MKKRHVRLQPRHRPQIGVRRSHSSDQIPTFPEIAQHERDAAAFWSRRISTSLAIGNGAGIIALSGFLSNATNIDDAAAFTFQSFSLFLSGLAFAFFSFFISLVAASTRMDAASEYLSKVETVAEKLKKTGQRGEFGEVWKQRPIIYTLTALVAVLQIGLVGLSGAFFYLGSAAVLDGLGKMACASSKGQNVCGKRPAFPFSMVNVVELNPTLVTVTGISKIEGQQSERWVGSLRVTPLDSGQAIGSIYFYQRLRLSKTNRYGETTVCYLDVQGPFSGDALSYDRTPLADRMIRFASENHGGVDLRPAELLISVFVERDGKLEGSQDLAVLPDATGGVGQARTTDWEGIHTVLVSGGRGLRALVDDKTRPQCLDLIRAAGIETLGR